MANPAINADFQIATTMGALATLKSLGVSDPHPIWYEGVTKIKLGDNSARVLGAAYVKWQWGFIQNTERDILRALCPGASAPMYIWTPTTEKVSGVQNAAARYLTQMWWPSPETPEDPQTGRRLQFEIIFRQLASV